MKMPVSYRKKAVFLALFVLILVSVFISPTLTGYNEVYAGQGSVESATVAGDDTSLQTFLQPAKENVLAASMLSYKINIRGDNLTRIANRFGIKLNDLLSDKVNPQLVKRNNPNLLYIGEVINIPVYRMIDVASVTTPLTEKVVIMTQQEFVDMGVRHDTAIAENDRKLADSADIKVVLVILAISGWALFCFAVVYGLVRGLPRKENGYVKLDEASKVEVLEVGKVGKINFENSSPEEILAVLRTARGTTLEAMNDLPLVRDESGNPVTLKKVREFMEKNRDYLRNLQVSQWEETMRVMKMNIRPVEKDASEDIESNPRLERIRNFGGAED